MTLSTLIFCALGGAAGAGMRFLLSIANTKKFPTGTFISNMLASAIICVALKIDSAHIGDFLAAGLAASLSTFSSFAFEILEMLEEKRLLSGALYATLSIALGIFLAILLI